MNKAEFVFRKLEMGVWHEVSNCYGPSPTGYGKLCAHCKSALFDVVGNELMPDNPTFTDGNGVVMLTRRIDEVRGWDKFMDYRAGIGSSVYHRNYGWFIGINKDLIINPPCFLDLVAKWLGYQEEGEDTADEEPCD